MPDAYRRRALTDNPEELDRWISSIEFQLFNEQLSNIDAGTTAQKVRGVSRSELPDIFGLAIDNNASVVGGISIKWSAVVNPDVLGYDLQFTPEDQAFIDPHVIRFNRLQTNSFTATGLSENTGYNVRVRAVGRDGRIGRFSPILNTSTGVIGQRHLAPDATKQLVQDIRLEDSPTFKPLSPSAIAQEWGSVSIQTQGFPIWTFSRVDLEVDNVFVKVSNPLTYTLNFYRENITTGTQDLQDTLVWVLPSIFTEVTGNNQSNVLATETFSGFTSFDLPSAGLYRYFFTHHLAGQVATTANVATITFSNLTLLELRR